MQSEAHSVGNRRGAKIRAARDFCRSLNQADAANDFIIQNRTVPCEFFSSRWIRRWFFSLRRRRWNAGMQHTISIDSTYRLSWVHTTVMKINEEMCRAWKNLFQIKKQKTRKRVFRSFVAIRCTMISATQESMNGYARDEDWFWRSRGRWEVDGSDRNLRISASVRLSW